MQAVRQFTLKNSLNEQISLNDLDFFGYEPEGLGISFENTYYGANANFLEDTTALNQSQFSINVLFGAETLNPYQKYNDFIRFLNYQPLYLMYGVPGIGTYERQCRLSEIPKTEINEYNVINETLTLDCVTPWYQWITMNRDDLQPQNGEGKIYVNNTANINTGYYVYPYIYSSDRTEKKDYFNLNNDSMYMGTADSSPLEIIISSGNRTIENPEWRIVQNSIEVQNDKYFITMPTNSTLIVSSEPQNQRAILRTSDGSETNVYQMQDMTKTNFVTAPLGQSTLHFEGLTEGISLRMRKEWVIV